MTKFDCILHGGRVIDPYAGVDGFYDIAIENGKIAEIGQNLNLEQARVILDVTGKLVLPGLIDTHTHVFEHVTGPFGVDADDIGIRMGVTTLVDQGSASYATLPAFRRFIVEQKKTRVLAFSSAFIAGGVGNFMSPQQYRPDCIMIKDAVAAAKENPDLIRGIKFHAEATGFSKFGTEPFEKALVIAKKAELPLYVHLGELWRYPTPEYSTVANEDVLEKMVDLLRPGDVVAHCFSDAPGTYTYGARFHPYMERAIERGVWADVGYGQNFSLKLAQLGFAAGFVPQLAGTDLHGHNARVKSREASRFNSDRFARFSPGHSMCSMLTMLLAVGYTLEQLVPMVTKNAAELIGFAGELGTLKPGVVADISVLDDVRGNFTLADPRGDTIAATRRLTPLHCFRAGVRFDCYPQDQPLALAS